MSKSTSTCQMKLLMYSITKLWIFVNSSLDLSIPFHMKSASHFEDASEVSLARSVLLPILYSGNSEQRCSRACDSPMANPWQSQLQYHNLPIPQAPAFNVKQYFSSSFTCLLAHAHDSLTTASDRPHTESRERTDTSHKGLQWQHMTQQL